MIVEQMTAEEIRVVQRAVLLVIGQVLTELATVDLDGVNADETVSETGEETPEYEESEDLPEEEEEPETPADAPKSRKVTPEEVESWVTWRNEGATMREIVEKSGRSYATVSRYLVEHDSAETEDLDADAPEE